MLSEIRNGEISITAVDRRIATTDLHGRNLSKLCLNPKRVLVTSAGDVVDNDDRAIYTIDIRGKIRRVLHKMRLK